MKIGAGDPGRDLLSEATVALYLENGPCAKKSKSEKENWQMSHLQYFEAAGVPWPPRVLAAPELNSCSSWLSEREMEVLFLANNVFPITSKDYESGTKYQFIDINDDVKRHFGPLPRPDQTYAKDFSFRCPWKGPMIMTLVGTSHIICRIVSGSYVLSCLELFLASV